MSSDKTLRELADEKGVTIGAGSLSARSFRTYPDDPRVPDTVKREFNAITPSSELKMGPLRPDRTTYDFEDADAVVNFGVANDLEVRGHTLVWHSQTPGWFLPWEYTDEQIEEFLRDHVHTVAGRYREKVDVWDVVNEPMAGDGSLRESVWYEAMGEAYIDKAFEWANDVAPDADLFLNDYGMDEGNEKADGMYDLVQRLQHRGVPIDGVGLQMHAIRSDPDPDSVGENVGRVYLNEPFTAAGEVYETTDERAIAEALVAAWLDSPAHRENLLAEQWSAQSVGVSVGANGTVYATHDFCER